MMFRIRKLTQNLKPLWIPVTHNILHDAEFQLELVGVVLLILPASAIILLVLMRQRIYSPLQQMGYLMEALGHKEYQTIRLTQIDPMFQPLIENYNRMVGRLSDLLTNTVRELLVLMRYQIPDHIHLEQNIPPGITCRLPDSQLRQALLNLILNARQALAARPGSITLSGSGDANGIILNVCDDGPGFPTAILEEGIRPFRTSRRDGTGLGLSMVERFARNHDGNVELHSHSPHGACVTLKLHCKVNHHG
ncbi:ATP-binding protein [Thiothrix lacustris]|uniref:ATP-binding protein n=1 Tax=Thiothrix lacustris TaxID=525917 RepID=UPI0027E45F68|nr:ATP-binding protein [Thiothrix lacustris]WMP16055.1 ATP-binding protein [Thiothrix lacustris]